MTYRGRRVNMEVDTIRPSASLGTRVCDITTAWSRPYFTGWRRCRVTGSMQNACVFASVKLHAVYTREYDPGCIYTVYTVGITADDQRAYGGEGGEERRKPLLRNFVNGAAPRTINVIKCWMRTCRRRWNCAFTRANSRQLSDATVDVAANTDSIKRRFRITNGTRRHCVTCGVQLEKRWICHETD